jgi:hypothetical protein
MSSIDFMSRAKFKPDDRFLNIQLQKLGWVHHLADFDKNGSKFVYVVSYGDGSYDRLDESLMKPMSPEEITRHLWQPKIEQHENEQKIHRELEQLKKRYQEQQRVIDEDIVNNSRERTRRKERQRLRTYNPQFQIGDRFYDYFKKNGWCCGKFTRFILNRT